MGWCQRISPAFFSWCVCYGDTNIFTSVSLKIKMSHSYQPVTLKQPRCSFLLYCRWISSKFKKKQTKVSDVWWLFSKKGLKSLFCTMRFTRYSSLWIQSLIMWSHHWTNNSHYGQAKKTSFLHLYCNEWSIDLSPHLPSVSLQLHDWLIYFQVQLLIGLFGTGGGGQLAACLWSHFWSYSLCLLFSGSLTDLERSWTPADLQGAPACCCMCLINAHGENMRRYLLTVSSAASSSYQRKQSEHRKGGKKQFWSGPMKQL